MSDDEGKPVSAVEAGRRLAHLLMNEHNQRVKLWEEESVALVSRIVHSVESEQELTCIMFALSASMLRTAVEAMSGIKNSDQSQRLVVALGAVGELCSLCEQVDPMPPVTMQ